MSPRLAVPAELRLRTAAPGLGGASLLLCVPMSKKGSANALRGPAGWFPPMASVPVLFLFFCMSDSCPGRPLLGDRPTGAALADQACLLGSEAGYTVAGGRM